jgi:NAD(P)-dependent dehydrogenase (short-subunit alcohol dehydrogenase family)
MTHSIIFGGSKGLGKVLARQFADRGDAVSVISRSEGNSGSNTSKIDYFRADISDPAAAASAIDRAINKNGLISYIVFCQRYRGGAASSWTGEIDISVSSSKWAVEYLLDRFTADSDRGIVFVSSVFGDKIGEGQDVSYHIGKAGMNHLARFYAVNLGPRGIRSNIVSPFTFLKEESRTFYLSNESLCNLYKAIVPLGRMAEAEDIANVIAFLCSSNAGFLTGQNLCVDGGLSAVWPETLARKLLSI